MRESYIIGAYWGARLESPGQCTERLLALLQELESCHELVARWNEQADTLAEAMRRTITVDRASLEPLFKAIEDPPHDLGYRFWAWNGRRASAERLSVMIKCGSVPPIPGLCNSVVLDLPDPSDAVATLYQPEVLLRMLRAIASAFEPDWAGLISTRHRDEILNPDDTRPAGTPYVSWMTYLRAKRLQSLAGPPPCESIDIPGRGTIFIITLDHRFSAETPDDVERARALAQYLEASGALVPIPPNEPF